jgi:molybdate transport system substrate-binding protein
MHRTRLTALALAALVGCASPEVAPMKEPLQVYAAGSLREVLTEIARDHEARTGQKVALTFGASGLLRERIEKGEGAMVFASADTQHPQRLAAAGGWAPHTVFVRNSLCALTQANVNATPQTLLATLLSPAVKLGTSTPKADPSGDYAWELFRKADQVRPGAYAALDAKALKLTGGPDSPKPPAGQGTYAWVMDQGQADVFLTYCTNAVASQKEVPRLKVVQVPVALQVGAAYGLTVRRGAPAQAEAFASALLAAPAQATFARYGCGKP